MLNPYYSAIKNHCHYLYFIGSKIVDQSGLELNKKHIAYKWHLSSIKYIRNVYSTVSFKLGIFEKKV